jgi:hypothetical protein
MRTLCVCALMVCALCGRLSAGLFDDEILKRGDSNGDNAVNVSDAIHLSAYLYQSGPAPPCLNQADVNKNGIVDGADSAYLLSWLFGGGPAPPSPGPYATSCTVTSPYVGCNSSSC